jgi:CTD kinase subunit gamma
MSDLKDSSGVKNKTADKMMIDPFEVRMRFTTQLQHLSAAVTSAQKAAYYALKYRDLDEDLHSCILEQLERVRPSPIVGNAR